MVHPACVLKRHVHPGLRTVIRRRLHLCSEAIPCVLDCLANGLELPSLHAIVRRNLIAVQDGLIDRLSPPAIGCPGRSACSDEFFHANCPSNHCKLTTPPTS